MTKQSAASPTVSLIMFTYNQERFAREAAESALAQDFSLLDIVFSDDRSHDRTFEILKEIAAGYDGPHRVRVIQNSENMGVAAHVLKRCSESESEIIVVAAGDDISTPDRVRETLKAFEGNNNLLAVWSRVTIIDEDGTVIREAADRPTGEPQPETFGLGNLSPHRAIQGCSAAYRSSLFDVVLDAGRKDYPEDILLSFLIKCRGGGMFQIPKPLVLYRQHVGAISNRSILNKIDAACDGLDAKHASSDIMMFSDFERIIHNEAAERRVDMKALSHAKDFALIRAHWAGLSFRKRCLGLLKRLAERRWVECRWMLLRLVGHPSRYPALNTLRRILRIFS